MVDLAQCNPDPRLDLETEQAHLDLNAAGDFVVRVVTPDGRVSALLAHTLTVTDRAAEAIRCACPPPAPGDDAPDETHPDTQRLLDYIAGMTLPRP